MVVVHCSSSSFVIITHSFCADQWNTEGPEVAPRPQVYECMFVVSAYSFITLLILSFFFFPDKFEDFSQEFVVPAIKDSSMEFNVVPRSVHVSATDSYVTQGEEFFSEDVLETSRGGILFVSNDVDEHYLATPELDQHSTEKLDFSIMDADAVDDNHTVQVFVTKKPPSSGRGQKIK